MRSVRFSLAALLTAGLLGAAAAGLPSSALAFSVQTPKESPKTVVKWPTNKISYFLNPVCSADLPQAACLDQLRAGFKGWMAVPCTNITFTEGYHCNTALGTCIYNKGTSCAQDSDCPAAKNLALLPMGGDTNGRNEVAFIETSAWTFGQYVLGVTSPVYYISGPQAFQITEADIALNGYSQYWTTKYQNTGNSTQDVLSVAIHEEGHFFGAQHVLGTIDPNDPPTMAPYVADFGKSQSLNADDQKLACYLHPKTGVYTCQNDSDCPYIVADDSSGKEYYSAKQICQNGQCTWGGAAVGGATKLGGACSVTKDCLTSLFCQPFGNESFCAQYCTTTKQDCPAGFTCFGYQSGGGKGACLPSQGQPDPPSKKPGDKCTSSAECTTLMCLSGVCRVKCTVNSPTECDAASEQCAKLPTGGIGACVAKDKEPAKLPLGAPCQTPDECESQACLKTELMASSGNCRLKCKGKGSCAAGFACVMQAEGFEACLPGSDKVPAGSACAVDSDCMSAKCLSNNGTSFCSQPCDAANPASCPCGMSCAALLAGNLCFPGKKVACVDQGGLCSADGECAAGGVCVGGSCKQGCNILTGQSNCGSGEACSRRSADDAAGACGAVGTKLLGDECTADAECKSAFCEKDVTQAGALRCQTPCNPAGDACGPGLACNALGANLGACFALSAVQPVADAGTAQPGAVYAQQGGGNSGCMAGARRDGWSALVSLVATFAMVAWRRRRAV